MNFPLLLGHFYRLQKTHSLKSVPPGQYYHFGLEKCLKQLLSELKNVNKIIPQTVEILINIHGVTNFKKFWKLVVPTQFFVKFIKILIQFSALEYITNIIRQLILIHF